MSLVQSASRPHRPQALCAGRAGEALDQRKGSGRPTPLGSGASLQVQSFHFHRNQKSGFFCEIHVLKDWRIFRGIPTGYKCGQAQAAGLSRPSAH